jgi:hypothetical protein
MCKNSERWVFTLPHDFSWESGFVVTEDMDFRDKTGAVRLLGWAFVAQHRFKRRNRGTKRRLAS